MAEPIAAQKGPYRASVKKGRSYLWCACGRSKRQPFCDDSHIGTGIEPLRYVATETGDVWFCGCKQSGHKPECDGTHATL